jgi:N-ethylmaleimide reductase
MTTCTRSPGRARCGSVRSRAFVAQFRAAAGRALASGFDGEEVHAANGYLLDQFLQDGANRRTDRYGGTPMNRARLLGEVTAAVIEVWGADRVGVRISPINPTNGSYHSDPAATYGQAAMDLTGWAW